MSGSPAKKLLLAKHVAPMNAPLLKDAGVVIQGPTIVATGPADLLRRTHSDAQPIDYGQAVILPGLINAHVHLELTAVGQLPRPGSFVDWVLALRSVLISAGDLDALHRRGTQDGIRQCLEFGVTTIGDITSNPMVTRPLLRQSPLNGVSFGEVLGMAGRAAQMPARLDAAIDRSWERAGLTAGIEPHAPYSLDLEGYQRCVHKAQTLGLPLATHLAETCDETEFLACHTGEFRRLWETLGAWSDTASRHEGGPIGAMQAVGLLQCAPLLAHVNYIDDEALRVLASFSASVVYCPRTHAYFGHPPHRFREMLAHGINVAIGTDSAASSPNLNLVDDLRLVHRQFAELDAAVLWEMVTTRAAQALGMEHRIGQLSSGSRADFCIFASQSQQPLLEVLDRPESPTAVWAGGDTV